MDTTTKAPANTHASHILFALDTEKKAAVAKKKPIKISSGQLLRPQLCLTNTGETRNVSNAANIGGQTLLPLGLKMSAGGEVDGGAEQSRS